MRLRLISTVLPLIHQLDKRLLWRVDTKDKVLYLTFDDGPIPELTPWVLDTLKAHGARATFFCLGRNVEAHPALFQRLKDEGHAVGNHTYDHPSGWRSERSAYYRSVLRCQALTRTDLFRPPYGRATSSQINTLRKRYTLVMWDVLSGDFEERMTGQDCVDVVRTKARPGSIIVFHDNLLSEIRMRYALPRVLEHFTKLGYRFDPLPVTTTG
jgi:peptidoglycan/xylan/chitin deacetylase (PgdA/CDA1 family)